MVRTVTALTFSVLMSVALDSPAMAQVSAPDPICATEKAAWSNLVRAVEGLNKAKIPMNNSMRSRYQILSERAELVEKYAESVVWNSGKFNFAGYLAEVTASPQSVKLVGSNNRIVDVPISKLDRDQQVEVKELARNLGNFLMLCEELEEDIDDAADRLAWISEKCVLYHPFDDDTSDYSGKNHHGSAQGEFNYQPGIIGNALTGQGMSMVSTADQLCTGRPEWTFVCWFKLEKRIDRYIRILEEGTSQGPYAVIGVMNDHAVRLNSWNKQYVNQSTAKEVVKVGEWNFLTVVAKTNGTEGVADVYLNGEKFRLAHATTIPDRKTRVGLVSSTLNAAGGRPNLFSGQMDEMRFYHRALTPEQVEALGKYPFE